MDADEFEALGLYEPGDPLSGPRLELLRYLAGLGATAGDLSEYRDSLPGLASVLALRGGPALTLSEVAERSGLAEAKILEFTRAAGFPIPGPDDHVFTEGFGTLGAGLAGAEGMFGASVVLQLIRVMGAAMARLADALVTAFLVNVEPGARREDPVGLGVARANAQAIAMLPTVVPALDLLLRQHMLAAQRTFAEGSIAGGYETQLLCVGFVDLVGSTRLAETTPLAQLGDLLTEFEHLVVDTVVDGGGRVIKLIGDEVLFTAGDPAIGCRIALSLIRLLERHPRLPPVRAGLAYGEVMLRDGDVFGPVVNLAARAVAQSSANDLVVPKPVADRLDMPATPLGPRRLKGFEADIELVRVSAG